MITPLNKKPPPDEGKRFLKTSSIGGDGGVHLIAHPPDVPAIAELARVSMVPTARVSPVHKFTLGNRFGPRLVSDLIQARPPPQMPFARHLSHLHKNFLWREYHIITYNEMI